jgi:hypothetical protein
VTITYPNGTVLKAFVLSHEENEIRAMAPGCPDALAFTRIHGNWISEDLEPVTSEFAWQRHGASPAGTEEDCICPQELATHLILTLFSGDGDGEEAVADTLHVFGGEGGGSLHRNELRAMWSCGSGVKVD